MFEASCTKVPLYLTVKHSEKVEMTENTVSMMLYMTCDRSTRATVPPAPIIAVLPHSQSLRVNGNALSSSIKDRTAFPAFS